MPRAPDLEGNENLVHLLGPTVRAIGPEQEASVGRVAHRAGIRLFVSPFGSYRFVAFDGDQPVSALQVMSRDGRDGVIANVYTAPSARRRGFARRLLAAARRRFRHIDHSTDLSDAGRAWAAAVRDVGGRWRFW